ncbi:MAG: tetratricopeptide repeat protein [Paludibacteraceae bacterium]|nr:tetratricopeptide repeat protein [Paludibacteraceae bacterium]
MKTKVILSVAAFGMMSLSGFAQTGVQSGTKFGHGADSIACVQNLTLMQQAAKQGDYKSAVEPWNNVFNNCPASHVSLYQYGPKILAWQLSQEKDAAKKEQVFNQLMSMYDNRAKYFGNMKKYGKPYILGRKAIDYVTYVDPAKDPDKRQAYNWLAEAIDLGGTSNEVGVFQQYFMLSDAQYAKDPNGFKQQYINDYLKVTPLLSERGASGDPKDSTYSKMKTVVDVMFAKSGAAKCSDLDKIYASQIDAKQTDKAFLKTVLALYAIADCEESSVFFKASAYMHKIEPTAGSARGLAMQAYNNKDYAKAIEYFKNAISLETNNGDKSNLYMKIAATYNKQGNYQQARSAAQSALGLNGSNSTAYILIAHLYANHCQSISDDPVIQKTAYWAAVDKLERAKSVDPSCAANVNKMISGYKANFPPATELFMRGIKAGASYTVPGWINETTKVRDNK